MVASMREKGLCESIVGAKVAMLRDFAAAVTSERVMSAIDAFGGRCINSRLDKAIQAALAEETADGRMTTRVYYSREWCESASHTFVRFVATAPYTSPETYMSPEGIELRKYGDDYGKEYHPETGLRLDAEAMKADLRWIAEYERERADRLELCLTDYDKIKAEHDRLMTEIEAFNKAHCYEGMKDFLEAYIG